MLAFVTLICFGCGQEGTSEKAKNTYWDYEEGNLKSLDSGSCSGTVQSPINIATDKTIATTDLESITFDYHDFSMVIENNSHTIEVRGDTKSTIRVADSVFKFVQFHFHSHSEHSINSEFRPMELHLVHQSLRTQNLTVLGIMLDVGDVANPFIESVWANIPPKGKTDTTQVRLNLNDILPANRAAYYTYTGSLTTFPYSQTVNWIVFKDAVQVSRVQVNKFESIHPHSFRPLQALNNRYVLERTEWPSPEFKEAQMK